MGKPFTIGLVGRQGSGKDEVAKILERRKGFQHLKFATDLKRIADQFEMLESGREDKETPREIRIDWFKLDMTNHPFKEVFGVHYTKARDLLRRVLEPYRVGVLDRHTGKFEISPRRFQQLLGTEVGRTINRDFWVLRVTNQYEKNNVVSDIRFHNEIDSVDMLVYVHRCSVASSGTHHSSEKLCEEFHSYLIPTPYKEGTTTLQHYRGIPVVVLPNHTNSLAKLSKDTLELIFNDDPLL